MNVDVFGKKILDQLQAVAEGNGIDNDAISLIGVEEIKVNLSAEMLLSLELRQERKSYQGAFQGQGRKGKAISAHALPSAQHLPAALDQFKEDLTESGEWIDRAVKEIRAEAGEGWGLDDVIVVLDDMAQIYYSTQACAHCSGSGTTPCFTCNRTGFVPCQRCNQSGKEICVSCRTPAFNMGDYQMNCPHCNTPLNFCYDCKGQRKIHCRDCQGKGFAPCPQCQGKGKETVEEKVTPSASCTFRVLSGVEMPAGLRRAISRGGMKVLAKGHATIKAEPVNQENPEKIFIPYHAEVPYVEARIRFPKKLAVVALLGHKRVLFDVPPFLDGAVEPILEELENAKEKSGGLKKAMQLRVMRDAFQFLQQGQHDGRPLRKKYRFGFSDSVLARVQKLVLTLMKKETIQARLLAGLSYGLLSGFLFWFFLQSGARLALAQSQGIITVVLLDGVMCALGIGLGMLATQFATAFQLRKIIGDQAVGKAFAQPQSLLDIALSIVPALIYMLLIGLMPSLPNWFG